MKLSSTKDFVYSQKLEQQILRVFQVTKNSLILKKQNLTQKFLFPSQDHVVFKKALPKCMLHITKYLKFLLEVIQNNSLLIKYLRECWINQVKFITAASLGSKLHEVLLSGKPMELAF